MWRPYRDAARAVLPQATMSPPLRTRLMKPLATGISPFRTACTGISSR
ncbi:hypothetical protein [Trinickia caryophylli]